MHVYGPLIRAQFENLTANPGTGVTGRYWFNTTDLKAYLDSGTQVRAFLLNDDKLIVGTSGTTASNVRIHRGAAALLQLVPGSDATAEGSLSTSLAQVSARQENVTSGALPASGSTGRLVYATDTQKLLVDTGASFIQVGDAAAGFAVVTKTANYTITSADQVIFVDTTAGDITITLPAASTVVGKAFTVKKISSDGYRVTIARTGADLLDGETSQVYIAPMTSVTWVSDGVSQYLGT